MISKECLSAVLGVEITGGEIKGSTYKYYYKVYGGYGETELMDDSINIHQLASECKEWAWDKGYHIESCIGCYCSKNGNTKFGVATVTEISNENTEDLFIVSDTKIKTESEAIFKATEWVYNATEEAKKCEK